MRRNGHISPDLNQDSTPEANSVSGARSFFGLKGQPRTPVTTMKTLLSALVCLTAFTGSELLAQQPSASSSTSLKRTGPKASSVLRSEPTAYRILSNTNEEMVIEVTPSYHFQNVRDAITGATLTSVSFAGGVYPQEAQPNQNAGAPGVQELRFPLLVASKAGLQVEVLSEEDSTVPDIALAPIAKSVRSADGTMGMVYHADPEKYAAISTQKSEAVQFNAPSLYRTTYAQTVTFHPVRISGNGLSLVRKAVIKITYPAAIPTDVAAVSQTERDFFRGLFLNGDNVNLYRCGLKELSALVQPVKAMKGSAQSAGSWLSIETDSEGVYRITAQDLKNAGVSIPSDLRTIELFGIGGREIDYNATSTSGEWRECAKEIITNGDGSFKELRFYAAGMYSWSYKFNDFDGLTHRINPYTATGHYYLKVGGELIGANATIKDSTDQLLGTPTPVSSVLSVGIHELERILEIPNVGREFLGESIPRGLQLNIDLGSLITGYAGGEVKTRVAIDTKSGDTHNVMMSIDGIDTLRVLGPAISSGQDAYLYRVWNNVLTSTHLPGTLSMNLQAVEIEAQAWLNYVEVFYPRKMEIGSTSIPFLMYDADSAVALHFTNASNGELWDVTADNTPARLASAVNSSIDASVQGKNNGFRRFLAFSESSLRSAHLTSMDAPTMREGIGTTGATDIIIAPLAFKAEAEKLRALREKGGDATEPMKTAVVYVEDIFREFGYGSRDPLAIRDFILYTTRHAALQGTAPLFVTLLGAGHADNLKRTTSLPNYVPIFEDGDNQLRYTTAMSGQLVYPNDAWLGTFPGSILPAVAVGRIPAHSEEEADAVVEKIKHYETGSAEGIWRATASFVADDHNAENGDSDLLNHFFDTENYEVDELQSRLLVNKIYEVEYPTIFTAIGRRKPEAQQALVDAMNQGSVLFSYIGHGNPKVWSHENILEVPSTINRFVNWDKLSFVTTATCDFSEFDDYASESGGVQMLMKPDGAAVSMLGTSRSVSTDPFVKYFYKSLFNVPCDGAYGTANVGTAYIAGRKGGGGTAIFFYILGDPALRLLVPKRYVVIDSINGQSVGANASLQIPALSEVKVSGRIATTCDGTSGFDQNFDGSATLTLFDAPTQITKVTTFTNARPVTDNFYVEGPILYRGISTVTSGRFSTSFIVPKDIKFDTSNAKIHVIAYAKDTRSALGATTELSLIGADSVTALEAAKDTIGPELLPFIGSRGFHSGDVVSMNSTLIVDAKDIHGVNTSTAGIGHSFIAWVDDSTDGAVDLASNYVSEQDNFRAGTSSTRVRLPKGRHTLHVRAFDALDNPTFASVEFVAKDDAPFQLYNVSNSPNPVHGQTTFTFTQPAATDNPVDVTLTIYSVDGRKVKELHVPATTSDVVSVNWDGLDDANHLVSSGAYYYDVAVGARTSGASAVAHGTFIMQR